MSDQNEPDMAADYAPITPENEASLHAALGVGVAAYNAVARGDHEGAAAAIAELTSETHRQEFPWVILAWADTILNVVGVTDKGPHVALFHQGATLDFPRYPGDDPDMIAAEQWLIRVLDARIADNYNGFKSAVKAIDSRGKAGHYAISAVTTLALTIAARHPNPDEIVLMSDLEYVSAPTTDGEDGDTA